MRHWKVRLMLAAENSQAAAGSNSNWIFRKILDSLMLTKVCMGPISVSQEQNMVLYWKKLSFMWKELCSHSQWFQEIITERFQFQWRNPDWRWRKCFSRAFSHGPVYFVLCVCASTTPRDGKRWRDQRFQIGTSDAQCLLLRLARPWCPGGL